MMSVHKNMKQNPQNIILFLKQSIAHEIPIIIIPIHEIRYNGSLKKKLKELLIQPP